MGKGIYWQGPGFVWIKVRLAGSWISVDKGIHWQGPVFMWIKVYIGRVLDLCG